MPSPLARQVIALGVAVAIVALSLAYPLRGYLQQQAAEEQAIAEQHELEQRISELQAEVAALKDPAYITAEAKRRLQYVTPGDTVYVLKVPSALTADTADAADEGAGATSAASDASGAPTETEQGSVPQAGDQPWLASLWDTLSGTAD